MLQGFMNWLGFGLCHQLPERSFFGGGIQAPVCARDTGIYVGFTVALLLIALLHRGERPTGFPRRHVWAVMLLLLAFMGWDGVTSYAGLRATGNGLRLLTGLGVGFSAAAVVAPMLNDELWRRATAARVLDPLWRFAAWLVAIPFVWSVLWLLGPRSGVAYPLLISASILFTLMAINLVIIAMLPWFDRKGDRLRDLALPCLAALGLAIAEIILSNAMRVALVGFATTF